MAKNYATSMSFQKTCMLKRDYSYIYNGRCLSCKFCYKHAVPGAVHKRRMAKMILFEEQYSPNLYKAPITISKYCDPNNNTMAKLNSRMVADRVLNHGGQVIWKTAIVTDLPEAFLDNVNVQYQGRVLSSDGKTGQLVRNLIAPKFDSTTKILDHLKYAQDNGIDVAVIFDPLIVGLNDADLYTVIKEMSARGIKKLIVKQLFSTDYFKSFLQSHVGRDCSSLLSEKVGPFWTYKNETLLTTMHRIMTDAKDYDILFSMCGNREVNSLINACNNCCMFESPNAIYDINCLGKGRYPGLIELKDK